MSLQSGTTVLSSFNVPKVENKAGRNQQQQQQQQQQQSTPSTTQDACIGTSVGTVTEPDCLGPCEPGTSVTLEGIVWHETESGNNTKSSDFPSFFIKLPSFLQPPLMLLQLNLHIYPVVQAPKYFSAALQTVHAHTVSLVPRARVSTGRTGKKSILILQ